MPSLQQYTPGYLALWKVAHVTRTTEARQQAAAVIRGKDRLMKIEAATGVPWYIIGIISIRESGLVAGNLDWRACLANGQRIIGTGRRTTLVPRGCGPWTTWEAAALWAIRYDGLDKLPWKDDLVPSAAYALERFNGFGYRNYGIPSPYLWGGTSVQRRGKYIRDGVFSYSVMDPQIGGMAILKILINEDHVLLAKENPPEKVDPNNPANKPVEGGKAEEPEKPEPKPQPSWWDRMKGLFNR